MNDDDQCVPIKQDLYVQNIQDLHIGLFHI